MNEEYVQLTDCPECGGLILDGNWCVDCDTWFTVEMEPEPEIEESPISKAVQEEVNNIIEEESNEEEADEIDFQY